MSDRHDAVDDRLAGALVALREEQTGRDETTAAETRRRVLLAATGQRRRKLLVLRVVVPLAAVVAIGTAWAAAGRRLPWEERAAQIPEPAPSTTAPDLRATAPLPAPQIPIPAPSPAALPEADAGADAGVDHAFAAGAPASAVRPTGAGDREDALYREAHEAHFVTRDAARALVAWERYLAVFPRGRLAPEARYNRALVLVRLGRTDEARVALTPFANAPTGSYRQAEARSLLDAIQ